MSSIPIPGTVRLVDLDGTSRLQKGKDVKDLILIPQPSADPNDPLNWSPKRKLRSSVWQIIWNFIGAGFINGLTPAYLLIERDTGISQTDLNLGNGLMYLGFAFANLITQPLALNFGRRPAAVYSMFVTSFLVLWAAYIQTAPEWYANRILIGICYSGIECLIELCITDTKFVHERGLHMGLYTWSLFGGPFLAPIPAGFIADAGGWRWINKMYAMLGFLTTIGTFLFLEETMFYRPHLVEEFAEQAQPTKGVEDAETKEVIIDHAQDPNGNGDADAAETVNAVHSEPGLSERLKLWGFRKPEQPNTFFKFLYVPIYLFRYPSIVFSGILVGSVLAWYNVLLGTIAQIFGGAPYNFSANMIGLTYLAAFIGDIVGSVISGYYNDKMAMFIARHRSGGFKEAEHRLYAAAIPMILHPVGCILYGVGAAHGIHWIGLCFGIVIITTGIVMGSTLALSYCIDCYKEVAGEALISVVIIRNVIGFSFSYAVTPMIDSLGLQGAFLLIAFLGSGVWGLCFVMVVFGKKMRKNSASSYWRLVEDHGFQAH